jgi:C1A family cysteine protease
MTLKNGILTEPGVHMGNHAILLVGAASYEGPGGGVIESGDTLMCVQNSWGDTWGTRGFGLIGPRAWQDMVLISATLAAV